jgi:hypothetical protein
MCCENKNQAIPIAVEQTNNIYEDEQGSRLQRSRSRGNLLRCARGNSTQNEITEEKGEKLCLPIDSQSSPFSHQR